MTKFDPLVRDVQLRLRDKGFDILADGIIGPRTLSAALAALGGAAEAPPPIGALRPSGQAVQLIQQFEGYARKLPDGGCEAYPDPATGGEPWTIGWGSTGPDIEKGTVWTREQAQARFEDHLVEFGAGVAKRIAGAPSAQHEFDAMVSLAYNIGLGNFGGSTLLKKHRAGDKAGAAAEFVRWNKAAGKVLPGLTRRRQAEAAMYRGQGG